MDIMSGNGYFRSSEDYPARLDCTRAALSGRYQMPFFVSARPSVSGWTQRSSARCSSNSSMPSNVRWQAPQCIRSSPDQLVAHRQVMPIRCGWSRLMVGHCKGEGRRIPDVGCACPDVTTHRGRREPGICSLARLCRAWPPPVRRYDRSRRGPTSCACVSCRAACMRSWARAR
jgi:hypothetical protein